jgi:hypothetical protein
LVGICGHCVRSSYHAYIYRYPFSSNFSYSYHRLESTHYSLFPFNCATLSILYLPYLLRRSSLYVRCHVVRFLLSHLKTQPKRTVLFPLLQRGRFHFTSFLVTRVSWKNQHPVVRRPFWICFLLLLTSLSLNAQVTVTGAGTADANGSFIYPITGLFGNGGFAKVPSAVYYTDTIYYTNAFGQGPSIWNYYSQYYTNDGSTWFVASGGTGPAPTVTAYVAAQHVIIDNPTPIFAWQDELVFYLDGVGHGFPYAASMACIWSVVMMLRPPRPPAGGDF